MFSLFDDSKFRVRERPGGTVLALAEVFFFAGNDAGSGHLSREHQRGDSILR